MRHDGAEALLGPIFDHLPCGVMVLDPAGEVIAANSRALELLGATIDELDAAGRRAERWQVENAEGLPLALEDRPAAVCLSRGPVHDFTMGLTRPDGRRLWLQVDAMPVNHPVSGTVSVTTFIDVTQHQLAERTLRAQTAQVEEMLRLLHSRHRQQEAIADLGRLALTGAGAQDLMDHAVALVAATLEADRVRVLELLPDGATLLLRAGVGWREGLVGQTTIEAEHSQAGYLLRHNEPIVVEDFRNETRFQMSWLLREHPVVSGIRAVIRGEGCPFGELAAYTAEHRSFNEDHVHFMRAMANVLAEALMRMRANDEVRRSLEQLRQTNESRRQLLARLAEAVEEERRRIAADVHDDSIQLLAAFSIRLQLLAERLDDPGLRQAMSEVIGSLADATTRLRRLIFDLRPDALDVGLAQAIAFYFEQTRTGADPEMQLDSRLGREPPPEFRLTIYRACQEALSNVRRHARASRVRVELRERDGGLVVTVADDGVGFDTSPAAPSKPGHLGLVAMRERAELASGRFEVESRPGAGTTVAMWFPMPDAEAAGPDR